MFVGESPPPRTVGGCGGVGGWGGWGDPPRTRGVGGAGWGLGRIAPKNTLFRGQTTPPGRGCFPYKTKGFDPPTPPFTPTVGNSGCGGVGWWGGGVGGGRVGGLRRSRLVLSQDLRMSKYFTINFLFSFISGLCLNIFVILFTY